VHHHKVSAKYSAKAGNRVGSGELASSKISTLQKMGAVASIRGKKNFWIKPLDLSHRKRIWLIGVDTNENLFASFDPLSN